MPVLEELRKLAVSREEAGLKMGGGAWRRKVEGESENKANWFNRLLLSIPPIASCRLPCTQVVSHTSLCEVHVRTGLFIFYFIGNNDNVEPVWLYFWKVQKAFYWNENEMHSNWIRLV